jgi:hypothetical protein
VHSESTATQNVSINCPAPVVDRHGRLHLLMTRNNFDVLYTRSDTCGRQWSAVRNISAQAKRTSWGWVATTFSAVELRSGRLLVGCDHAEHHQRSAYPTSTHHSHVMYSDDGGTRWAVGGSAPLNASDEASVAQVTTQPAGLLSSRSEGCNSSLCLSL